MKNRIIIHPKADQDLDEQFGYIAHESADTAMRFLDAAQATFEQLAAMPELGSVWQLTNPLLANVRVWQVRGFKNHLVFYCPTDPGIRVIRVLHGARDITAIFEQEE